MNNFVGRKAELAALQSKYNQDGFAMAVLYGRRRIGKTTLINHFISEQSCKSISFTAVERGENELLSLMTETVLSSVAPDFLETVSFSSFEKLFEFIGREAQKEKIIFCIDEYPYLAKQCPHVQSILQKIIDYNWKESNLFFIICGSLVGFMKEEVIGKAAPLHGRSDLELKLKPFNYLETAAFLDRYSFEEKAIVYGLTNGIAQYIRQFDTKKPLEQNIIEQFYSIGGYFSEEHIKTIITGDRQNPPLFNSIISAIATGHTKNSEIASYCGMSDITYPLKVLTKAELIEKRMSTRPYYVLTDSMLSFWFKYVGRATSLINAGKGELYYKSSVKENLHSFMGRVFEKMAAEYLFNHAGNGTVPLVTEITDYQKSIIDNGVNKQIEIDLIGQNNKTICLLAECKFKNTKFDKQEYEQFMDKIQYIPAKNPKLFLFSLSGFSNYVIKHAKNTVLVDIQDMYA